MVEEWRNIIGYRFYQVSNFGRVKSLSRQIVDVNKSYILQERILNIKYTPYGDKQNNHVDNLEWCTCSGNIKHSYDIGLRISPMKNRHGSKNVQSKKVYQYDGKILINEFESACLAAKYTGNTHGSISRACRGERSTLKGFIWSYTPLLEKDKKPGCIIK